MLQRNETWWPPYEIRFTWEQVEWLFEIYFLISEGQWPPEPKRSGYSEFQGVVNVRTKKRRWAFFEIPCDIAAELDERMKLIGEDSSILRDIYIMGMDTGKAAILRGVLESELIKRKNEAMKRMTGWRRKTL